MSAPSILILEDEALIAMDLEYLLNDAGFADVTVLTSCAEGNDYLSEKTPALAIIDLHLKDGACNRIAEILVSRDIPFIVGSGSDVNEAHEVFSVGIWISKPWEPAHMLSAVRKALANAAVVSDTLKSASA